MKFSQISKYLNVFFVKFYSHQEYLMTCSLYTTNTKMDTNCYVLHCYNFILNNIQHVSNIGKNYNKSSLGV